jgi:hypothetical protein
MTAFTKFHIVNLTPSHSLRINTTNKANKDFVLGDCVVILIFVISN